MSTEKTFLTPDVKAVLGSELTGDPDLIERNDVKFFAEAIRCEARSYRAGSVEAGPVLVRRSW